MKKIIVLVILFVLITFIAFAVPNNKKCALCSSKMIWTGKSKTEWGKMVYEMKCPANHISWEVDEQKKAPNNNGNSSQSCQFDGASMIFTGRTKTEWGKLLKEYKCPVGHISWVVN